MSVKIGIIGGAGYTAGELLRLLINHPEAEIVFVHSSSNAGHCITDVHEGLIGETDIVFADSYDLSDIDVLFLCQGHGFSAKFWSENPMPQHLKVIDMAQDYRDESNGYTYGLPEFQRNKILNSRLIANPGCFATAIQLSLLPLAAHRQLNAPVQITGITGSTGAGVKPGASTHFSWRTDNLSVYKPFGHQHLAEIRRTLSALQPGFASDLNFIPIRGNFARGIFAVSYLDCDLNADEIRAIYSDYYRDAVFTHLATGCIDLKQAVNTNKAIIGIEKHGTKLMITTAIDNLLKGASGQAVQNMNLICGLPEDMGLRLKPSAF